MIVWLSIGVIQTNSLAACLSVMIHKDFCAGLAFCEGDTAGCHAFLAFYVGMEVGCRACLAIDESDTDGPSWLPGFLCGHWGFEFVSYFCISSVPSTEPSPNPELNTLFNKMLPSAWAGYTPLFTLYSLVVDPHL